jgi:dolichol-phosphate mannosyltransferase
LWLLTDVAGLFYLLSAVLAAFVSILNDYFFHDRWTFNNKKRRSDYRVKFAKFLVSKSFGILVGLAVLAFFTQVIGFQYLISNFFAVGITFVLNYFLCSRWIWLSQFSGEKDKKFGDKVDNT